MLLQPATTKKQLPNGSQMVRDRAAERSNDLSLLLLFPYPQDKSRQKEFYHSTDLPGQLLSTRCILVTGMTSKLTVKQKVYKEHWDHIVHYSSTWGFCFLPAEVLKIPYKKLNLSTSPLVYVLSHYDKRNTSGRQIKDDNFKHRFLKFNTYVHIKTAFFISKCKRK